jgi:hypothetical protein
MINSATGFLADRGGDRPARRSHQETARFPRASPANRADPRLLASHTFCVGMLDLASVSTSVRSISNSVRRTPPPVSANLRRKPPLIARRAAHHCAPLHVIRGLMSSRGSTIGYPRVTRSGRPDIGAAVPSTRRLRDGLRHRTAGAAAFLSALATRSCAVRQPQLDRIVCASSARAASISHARRICRGDRDETAPRTSLAVLASISGHSSRRSAISFGMLARSKNSASGSR